MILSDRDIRRALGNGRIKIDPARTRGVVEELQEELQAATA